MKTWRRTQDAGWNEGAKLKFLEEGFVSNKPWGSGERFEIFFRYYNTSIQGILVCKNEQVEPKLQVEATTCQVYISAGEESTEDLVVQFYRDMGVHGGGGEEHVEEVQLLPVGEVNCHLNLMMVKLQKSHKFVTKTA